MTHFATRLVRTIKRPLVLTGLVLLPLGWGAVDTFAKDHAFLINASPSLPNWAFWLDKHARIERGSLIFFEPPASRLVEVHFGNGAQLFGKRVLGVPGDVVSHRGHEVFINGRKIAARLSGEEVPLMELEESDGTFRRLLRALGFGGNQSVAARGGGAN